MTSHFLRRKDGAVEAGMHRDYRRKGRRNRHLRFLRSASISLDNGKGPKSNDLSGRGGASVSRGEDRPDDLARTFPDQELITGRIIGYYITGRGHIGGSGASMGRDVTCEAYVELTGLCGEPRRHLLMLKNLLPFTFNLLQIYKGMGFLPIFVL